MLSAEERDFFEEHLQAVLAELPQMVKDLILDIPLIVDDYPSKSLCKKLNLAHRGDLCGLYAGISLDDKSIEHSGDPSDAVYLFRRGILEAAMNKRGKVSPQRLRDEIRLTILHEYGHHHGLDEQELEDLGY